MGSLVDVDAVNIKRGEMLNNIRLVNIPMGLFVVKFGGTSVGKTNWREGEMVRAKSRESAPLTVGRKRSRS